VTRVTVVVLTYNRQRVLRRHLLYYANRPIHIIFADGSQSDWDGGSSGSIGAMTWEYFRQDGFSSYFSRMFEASLRTNSEFVALLDDEEVLLWSGIQKSISFLDQNSEHSSAGGRVYTTTLTRKRLSLVPHYADYNSFDLLDDDPLSRFGKLFNTKRTKSFYYRLIRTPDFKIFAHVIKNFSTAGKYAPLAEFQLLGVLALFGKQTACDFPFHIRNGGSQHAHTALNQVAISKEDIIDSCKNFQEACRLRDSRASSSSALISVSALENLMSGLVERVNNKIKFAEVSENSNKFYSKICGIARRQKTVLIDYLGTSCFDYFPALYHFVCPKGRKTFAYTAETYAPGNQEIFSDFRLIEEIWTKFPDGLKESQFKENLRGLIGLEAKNI